MNRRDFPHLEQMTMTARRSGRTHRMILRAVAAIQQGERRVVVAGHTLRFARTILLPRVTDVLLEAGISYLQKGDTLWIGDQTIEFASINGRRDFDRGPAVVFEDHYRG